MNPVAGIARIVHIIAGSCALLFGLIPICVPKGKRFHRLSGNVYYYSMAVLAVTSVILFLLKPFSDTRLMLAFIGVFSYYLTFSGIRSWEKYPRRLLIRIDTGAPISISRNRSRRAAARGIAFAGVAMLIIAGHHAFLFFRTDPAESWNVLFPAILYAMFGWFSFGVGRTDLKELKKPGRPAIPTRWSTHVSRLLGAYTATVTAFLVVNSTTVLHSNLNIFLLILPGAIAGVLIPVFVVRGRRKTVESE